MNAADSFYNTVDWIENEPDLMCGIETIPCVPARTDSRELFLVNPGGWLFWDPREMASCGPARQSWDEKQEYTHK